MGHQGATQQTSHQEHHLILNNDNIIIKIMIIIMKRRRQDDCGYMGCSVDIISQLKSGWGLTNSAQIVMEI